MTTQEPTLLEQFKAWLFKAVNRKMVQRIEELEAELKRARQDAWIVQSRADSNEITLRERYKYMVKDLEAKHEQEIASHAALLAAKDLIIKRLNYTLDINRIHKLEELPPEQTIQNHVNVTVNTPRDGRY